MSDESSGNKKPELLRNNLKLSKKLAKIENRKVVTLVGTQDRKQTLQQPPES